MVGYVFQCVFVCHHLLVSDPSQVHPNASQESVIYGHRSLDWPKFVVVWLERDNPLEYNW